MRNSVLHQQKGVGLIEVLITLLIMSTSLIALASLQTRSLQFNQGAYLRSQANIYAYDILDRIRVNSTNLGAYGNSPLASFDGNPAATPIAQHDLESWRKNIATYLPNGKGGVVCDGERVCEITIEWDELNSSGQVSEDKTTFTYSARL